jgi:hypothetical protein
MSNWIASILTALILGALLITGSAVAVPRLTLPETEFDFGYAPREAKISHVFWLHSTGTDTLKIIQVNPG